MSLFVSLIFLALLGCTASSGVLYPPDSYFTDNVTLEESIDALAKFSDEIDKSSSYIRKTQFKVRNRLLFIAGLEGTGHHAWEYAIYYCTSRSICIVEEDMTGAMMHIEPKDWTLHGLFGNEKIDNNIQHLAYVYKRMRDIAEGNAGHAALHIIGIGLVRHSGMMSYPNYDVANKALARPDVTTMAALAESAKVDFRVLVLQRNPASILASVERRKFGMGLEPLVLQANADSMYFQLRALDPKFYRCFRYESNGLLSPSESKLLLKFMTPSIGLIWGEMLSHLRINNASTSDTDDYTLNSDSNRLADSISDLNRLYHLRGLELRVNMIDSLCAAHA